MMYDLAIIGGGPAGYTAAARAVKEGLQVVLFEKEAIGGTCLNVGCIPTKTLLYSAKQYYQARHALKYGVSVEAATFDYEKMVQRKNKIIRKLAAGIKASLQGCTMVSGAVSVSKYTDEIVELSCGEETYQARNILLCMGSVPFMPPIPGADTSEAVWTSTDALASKELPQRIAIVGGGVIGMEFATLYMELGVEVTVIEAAPSILPGVPAELTTILRTKYEKEGVRFLEATRVTAIDGQKITYLKGEESGELEADKILIAVGRKAQLSGVEQLPLLTERGYVCVDACMRTNLKNVYAAGDVTGKIQLAHVASRQAEVAVDNLLGKHIEMPYNAIPSVVYTNPEIACIGQQQGEVEKSLPMSFSGRFVAENEGENGLIKLFLSENEEVVGVSMIGNPCSEFVAAAAVGMQAHLKRDEWQKVVFPHPTVSEILKEVL